MNVRNEKHGKEGNVYQFKVLEESIVILHVAKGENII